MNSKYNSCSFPLRGTVSREKVRFHNRCGHVRYDQNYGSWLLRRCQQRRRPA